MFKLSALICGILLIVIGVFGFIPEMVTHGLLFDFFHTNTTDNVVHVISGCLGVLCGLIGKRISRIFLQTGAIFYAVLAVLGFYFGDRCIWGVFASNFPDAFLHAFIASLLLFLGFLK